ncbi:MAG: hypothetical protein K0R50_2929 [Eubacterium sp.]|jgi:hypothetical protein|nr:hypothetical protein [Eubacterium sp.]
MKKVFKIMGIDFGLANTLFIAFNNCRNFYWVKSASLYKG